MSVQERVDNYMMKEDHPLAKEYFRAVFDVLLALHPDITDVDGFGCMRMLELTTISLKDGRVIHDPLSLMGTISDISETIAVVFAPIESRAGWWASGYPERMSDPEVVSTADKYSSKLKTLSIVESIST